MQTKLQISISAREQLGCCFWDKNRRTSGPLPGAPVGAGGGCRVSRTGSWEPPFLARWRSGALNQRLDSASQPEGRAKAFSGVVLGTPSHD